MPVEARIPQVDELDVARQYLGNAFNAVENVLLELEHVLHDDDRVAAASLDAGQAWELTQYAREVQSDAERLLEWSKEIEQHVGTIWTEYREEREALLDEIAQGASR
jgi:hypothetical protein